MMEDLIDEITYNIPIELTYTIVLENIIWKSDFSKFEIAKFLIHKVNKEYIQKLIFHVSQFNIFSYKFLGDIFAETKDLAIKLNLNPFFCDYLLNRNLIKESDLFYDINRSVFKPIIEYENPIKEDSIWSIIRKDDINSFTSFLSVHDINFKLENVKIFQTTIYLNEFIAYCGAINIAKYMILNNHSFDNFYTIKYAVQGGHEDIIEFFIEKGYKFEQQLINAIAFHQNKIAIWLYQRFQNNINYKKCIQTYNTDMFLYFLFEKHLDVHHFEFNEDSYIECAASYENDSLYNYLKSL